MKNDNILNNTNIQPPSGLPDLGKKNDIELNKKDIIFSVLFFVSAFLIVDFVIFNGFNLGFTIAFAVLFGVLTAYLYTKESRISVFSCLCGAMSLAGAVTFSLYDDWLMNFIMLFLICALFCIYICSVSSVFKNKMGSFKMLLDVLESVFIAPLSNAGRISSAYNRAASKNKISKSVIVGILLALPVLLVIIPLLASSDAAFENLLTIVLKNIGIYLVELVLAVIITPFIVFYAVSKKYSSKIQKTASVSGGKGVIQPPLTISFLSVISLTYVVYLFSQLAYFFSAFSGILPEGYTKTASEYARRGFYEMFAICVINMVIIGLANALTKRKKGKITLPIKLLSTFVLAFTVLILITAMQKMKLNVEIYGLSKNRLLVFVFMLMIMIIIFFYILHIFLPKVSYMQPIIVICSAMFIALSFADINSIVCDYNIRAYNNGDIKSIDVNYINDLSDSCIDGIIELADCDDHIVSKQAKSIIMQKLKVDYRSYFGLADDINANDEITYKPDFDFRSYNKSEDTACRLLEEYYNSLSPEDREKLIIQYNFDNGDYYYNENEDIYELYGSEYYTEYAYNEDSGMYELSQRYKLNEYGVYDETQQQV